jgi:hypothetical protein
VKNGENGMNEAVKVKVEEKTMNGKETRRFRDGSATPLKHTAKINPFFEGVYRQYRGGTVGKPVAGFIRGIWHFSWIVARYNKDGLLRGRHMSGARPIKMPYTTDQGLF